MATAKYLGSQEAEWLYSQTKELNDMGVSVTYSGDQPFLLRLILGISVDYNYKSMAPMYFDDEETDIFAVNPDSRMRSDLNVNFRQSIPKTSIVYFRHITNVAIDPTHARTRTVESDLQKCTNKILREKKVEVQNMAIRRLEKNLTERQVKSPSFVFKIENKSCGPISLSGTDAEVAIAEIEDIGTVCSGNLFDGVFSATDLIKFDKSENSHIVLSRLHPDLFQDGQVSLLKVAELWRRSLNILITLLRCRKQFNASEYKKWSETYYQVCLVFFPKQEALTPYKVKLLLINQIMEQGYIKNPWNHMTESLEKSNHQSQKVFYAKRMMGGGKLYQWDPMLLNLYFGFLRVLKVARSKLRYDLDSMVASFSSNAKLDTEEIVDYLTIVQNRIPSPEIEIGAQRPKAERLRGMRFLLLGHYKVGQTSLQSDIRELGGTVISIDQAKTLLRNYSDCPHCYIVLENDEILRWATDRDKNVPKNAPQKTVLLAQKLQIFAGRHWKFLRPEFIVESVKSDIILDPNQFALNPGAKVIRSKVNDMRPLLKRQRNKVCPSGAKRNAKQFKKSLSSKILDSSSEFGSENE